MWIMWGGGCVCMSKTITSILGNKSSDRKAKEKNPFFFFGPQRPSSRWRWWCRNKRTTQPHFSNFSLRLFHTSVVLGLSRMHLLKLISCSEMKRVWSHILHLICIRIRFVTKIATPTKRKPFSLSLNNLQKRKNLKETKTINKYAHIRDRLNDGFWQFACCMGWSNVKGAKRDRESAESQHVALSFCLLNFTQFPMFAAKTAWSRSNCPSPFLFLFLSYSLRLKLLLEYTSFVCLFVFCFQYNFHLLCTKSFVNCDCKPTRCKNNKSLCTDTEA